MYINILTTYQFNYRKQLHTTFSNYGLQKPIMIESAVDWWTVKAT